MIWIVGGANVVFTVTEEIWCFIITVLHYSRLGSSVKYSKVEYITIFIIISINIL